MSEEPLGTLSDGRYRLDSILGEGGMAVVYKAWDMRLKVHRAIKVLLPAVAQRTSLRHRFESEAQTMARLHHPNILMVHDVASDGGRPYMVMELVKGGSMADMIEQQGSMLPDEALDMCAQVLEALQFAHEEGVIHRDIKPANILVTHRGVPKVADFGIARVMSGDHTRTRTGSLMGTWTYMAPELRVDATKASPQTDIYAVATMLYVAVSGRKPFDLHATNLHDHHFDGIAHPIQAIMAQGGSYFAEHRFASADEMRQAMQKARADIQELPAEARERMAPPPASDTLAPPSSQPGPTPAPFTPPPGRSVETISFSDLDDQPSLERPAVTPVPAAAQRPVSRETISFESLPDSFDSPAESPAVGRVGAGIAVESPAAQRGPGPMAATMELPADESPSVAGGRPSTAPPAGPGETISLFSAGLEPGSESTLEPDSGAVESPATAVPESPAPEPDSIAHEPPPERKRGAIYAIGGIGALCAVALLGWQLFGSNGEVLQTVPEPVDEPAVPVAQIDADPEPVELEDIEPAEPEAGEPVVEAPEPEPEPEPEPVEPAPAPTPKVEVAASPPPERVAAPAPKPAQQPAVAAAPEPAPEPESAAAEVSLLVLADPMDGSLTVDGRSAAVGSKITVAEGVHSFVFQGPGGEQRCKKLITTGMKKIKFTQGQDGCQVM